MYDFYYTLKAKFFSLGVKLHDPRRNNQENVTMYQCHTIPAQNLQRVTEQPAE
jgi:hypothetical protein